MKYASLNWKYITIMRRIKSPLTGKKMFKIEMKKSLILLLLCIGVGSHAVYSQESGDNERHGKTLNLGVGIGGYSGYYGYIGRTVPVLNINYEFDVTNHITLAPFVSFYSFRNEYYWGDPNNNYPFRNYYYRETVIPIGVKGTVYLDKALRTGPKWDIYLAGSVGFAIVNSRWDGDYYGDKNYYRSGRPLFLDLHIGAEYRLNSHAGLYLDLSNGVSTIGLALR